MTGKATPEYRGRSEGNSGYCIAEGVHPCGAAPAAGDAPSIALLGGTIAEDMVSSWRGSLQRRQAAAQAVSCRARRLQRDSTAC